MSLKAVITYLSRILLLTIVLIIATMIGSAISGLAKLSPSSSPEEAGRTFMILIMIGFINMILLSWVLVRTRWRGWQLVLAVGIIYFGITTFMAQLETLYFSGAMKIDNVLLFKIILSNFITSIILIPIAILLFKKVQGNSTFITLKVPYLPWKLPMLAIIYTIIYFIFGYFIAWQSADVRLYYTGSADIRPFFDHMINVFRTDSGLIIFQLFRGLLWTGFVALILHCCAGKKWELILLSGLLLGLLFTLQLLLPNPFMPADVRMPHFLETSTSTFLFGVIAAIFLLDRATLRESTI